MMGLSAQIDLWLRVLAAGHGNQQGFLKKARNGTAYSLVDNTETAHVRG
jgi:hypothetical protein